MPIKMQRQSTSSSDPPATADPSPSAIPVDDHSGRAHLAASIGRSKLIIGQTVESNSLYTIDQFAQAIMEAYPTPSFIKDTLFGNLENWWGETVAIDFYRASARVSPFTTPYKRGIAIPRARFRTQWAEAPNIKVTRDIRALDGRYRVPGESPVGGMAPSDRIATLQVMDYDDLDMQITRREELMCCQVLFDGKLIIYDGDDMTPLQEINFGPVNETVINPADYWDQGGSNPLEDLRAMQRIVNAAGYPADTYILGRDAADAFLANDSVKESSNFLNYRVGVIDAKTYTSYEDFGVSVLGNYMGMSLVSYDAMYEDPHDKLMHYYFPPDKILLASSRSQNRFTYSRISQVGEQDPPKVTDYNLPRVPQYIAEPETDQILFRLWARPLPVPTNMLTFTTAKVCALRSIPILLPVP